MRTLISLLVLSAVTIGLPGLHATVRPALAAAAPHAVQARGKKKRARPKKAPKADKTTTAEKEKKKKNDRGFEL